MTIIRRFAACLALLYLAGTAGAQTFELRAEAAWVYDQTTGTVLLEKNADEPLPPASMSKLMTLYMAFDAIANGVVTVDDEFRVSAHASSFGGSTMFLREGERVRVEDLLRGVIVKSGNDASVVLAEGLGGTEPEFSRMMTEKARQLGMMNSTFLNASGWPAAGHRMSMRDLGILADRLIADFPTFYPLFAEEEFAYDNRAPANNRNRNPVLGLGLGADGLKTGHTQEAGYGLVGSAKQGDRRIIFVITGLETPAERAEESERIINWAFRQFVQSDLGRAGERIGEAEVWMGAEPTVGIALAEDLNLLVPILQAGEVEAEAIYRTPLAAPIAQGDVVGELVVARDGLPETRVPLVAESAVAQGGFGVRLRTAAQVLLGKLGAGADDPSQAAAG